LLDSNNIDAGVDVGGIGNSEDLEVVTTDMENFTQVDGQAATVVKLTPRLEVSLIHLEDEIVRPYIIGCQPGGFSIKPCGRRHLAAAKSI
jgi:hypothetical protein